MPIKKVHTSLDFDSNNLHNKGVESTSNNAVITPTIINADQNDYNPTGLGTSSILRISSSVAVSISGIVAPILSEFRELTIINVGTNDITLLNSNVLSAIGNRFLFPSNIDITIPQNGVVHFQYDTTTSSWRGATGSLTTSGAAAQGEIYFDDNANTQTLTLQNTYYKITPTTWVAGSNNGFTPNVASQEIVANVGGTYLIVFQGDLQAANNDEIEVALFVNGTHQNNLESFVTGRGAVQHLALGFNGFAVLAPNDIVDVRVKCTNGVGSVVSFKHCNLSLQSSVNLSITGGLISVTYAQLTSLIGASGLIVGQQYLLTDFATKEIIPNSFFDGTYATSVLTTQITPADGTIVTIGTRTYVYDGVNFLWSNLINGFIYGDLPSAISGDTLSEVTNNPNISQIDLTAITVGVIGNSIVTDVSPIQVGFSFPTLTLTGGIDPSAISVVTGGIEPLIFEATTINTISANVLSTLFPADELFYEVVDSTTAGGDKGRIYFRKDTINNNSIWYDWRVVKFRRWETAPASGVFTVLANNGGAFQDFFTFNDSAIALGCYNNVIGSVDQTLVPDKLNNSIFYCVFYNNTIGGGCYQNTLLGGGFTASANNNIGVDFSTNIIADNFLNNTIADSFYINFIGSTFYGNNIGSRFQVNSIGNAFASNSTGSYCSENTFGDGCQNNVIASSCTQNLISISYTTIGTNFNGNTGAVNKCSFGNYCYGNSFGSNFIGNIVGNDFFQNSFANLCTYNTFASACYNNVFNGQVESNLVGAAFHNNALIGHFRGNDIGNDFINNEVHHFGGNATRNSFANNTFGNEDIGTSAYNVFGDFFYNNVLGDHFEHNNIPVCGNTFINNSYAGGFTNCIIGVNFLRNTVGVTFDTNTIGINCQDNVFKNNNRSLVLGDNFNNNNVENDFLSVNLSTATLVYSISPKYTKNITKRSNGTFILSYVDNTNAIIFTAPTT
jgi:hypothetical protein